MPIPTIACSAELSSSPVVVSCPWLTIRATSRPVFRSALRWPGFRWPTFLSLQVRRIRPMTRRPRPRRRPRSWSLVTFASLALQSRLLPVMPPRQVVLISRCLSKMTTLLSPMTRPRMSPLPSPAWSMLPPPVVMMRRLVRYSPASGSECSCPILSTLLKLLRSPLTSLSRPAMRMLLPPCLLPVAHRSIARTLSLLLVSAFFPPLLGSISTSKMTAFRPRQLPTSSRPRLSSLSSLSTRRF
mmetsp:Transcript_27278/g.63828  ORF Transcript_27278/g.63828 Transcript_27278/m.63828 type:complete len:242 (+) Transcript_27278:780-1505(+)